ncbi:MAG: radical SAM protein [Verrucomicrobia bacterium]|nr:radical SAM protein [Verrucomicrobiota bacterium]
MPIKTELEIDASGKSFGTGLLPELITALRRCRPGDLLAVVSPEAALGVDLELWCRFTRNTLVETTTDSGQNRWVIRCGEPPADNRSDRPVGSRLWLYTNFDCNLHCDYCCVRSSPKAPRRELGLARVQQIVTEAAALGVGEFFLTGGEPFLLPDIAQILVACTAVAPTTVLTNGALFGGRRFEALRSVRHDRLTLQISLDSPTPEIHDLHRGKGTWERALKAIELARAEGFRVRLAATVSTDEQAEEFERFLDARQIGEKDRVIRRIALRGFAIKGMAVARADLVPEVTITADGVYWHPVGADDPDLLITRNIFPLAEAFAAVRRAFEHESEHGRRLASIFNCA